MGLAANAGRVEELVNSSLMLVTALTPHIGYDLAAKIAKHALAQGITLREAAIAFGHVPPEQFDLWVDARLMTGLRRSRWGG